MTGRRQLLALLALLLLVLAVGVRVHLDASERIAERAPAPVVAPASDGPRLEGAPPAPAPELVSGRPKEESGIRGEVRVRVLDENGAPVEGAEVRVVPQGGDERKLPLLRTDATGQAVARDLPPGEAWAYVEHRQFMREMERADVASGAPACVEVRLVRRIRVRGRVTLPDGTPAPQVPIDWFAGGSAEGRTEVHRVLPEFEEQTHSAADGTFEVFLAPERLVTLVARLEPYADAELALIPRTTRDDVRLVLRPGGALVGVVRAPDGRPEPGAQVFVVPDGVPALLADPRSAVGSGAHATWPELGDDGIGRESGPATSSSEGPIHRAWITRSDDEGRWRVTRLSLPGRYRVLAEGREAARGGSEPVEASPPGSSLRIEVALTTRHMLHVRLVGENGKTLRGRCVLRGARNHFLEPSCPPAVDEGGLPSRTSWSEEDRSPRYAFYGLVPGDYVLEAHPDGAAPRRTTVRVLAQPVTEVRVEAQPGSPVEVVVVDREARPVQRAFVRLSVAAGPGGPAQQVDGDTDASGRVTLSGVREGTARLLVRHEEHVPLERDEVVAGPGPIRCVLLPRARVRFELHDSGLGPDSEGPWVWEAGTDVWEQGRARHVAGTTWEYLATPAPGASLFVVRPEERGARFVLGRWHIEAGAVVNAGTVRVDAGREIAGRVLDPEGRGVAGAVVLATLPEVDDAFLSPWLHTPSGTTDAEGRFVIRGVQHAPAVLRTVHATWAPASAPHAAGEPAPELKLVAGAWLVAQLSHAGLVVVNGPDGTVLVAELDPGRPHRLGPLPPGAHHVRTFKKGEEKPLVERTLTLAAGEEVRLDG